jgi:VWFA-related protein
MSRGARLGALVLTPLLALAAGAQEPVPRFSETVDVRVVEIEVEVVDDEGAPVVGLERSQFELRVDGRGQEIEYFDEIRPIDATRTADGGIDSAVTDAGPTPRPESAESLNILLFIDEAYSMPTDRDRTISAAAAQLDHLAATDHVSIVAWNGERLDLLLPWSEADSAAVRGALSSASRRPTFGLRNRSQFGWVGNASARGTGCRSTDCASTPSSTASPWARLEALEVRDRLEEIGIAAATALRSVPAPPGRNIAALLAGGWTSEMIEPGDMLEAWTPLLQAADQLRFALYPVDVPGMSSTAEFDSTDDIDPLRGGARFFMPGTGRADETLLHTTLRYLADETGGEALVNAGRRQLFATVSERARSFYRIGFSAPRRQDGRSHEIEVRVAEENLKLRHRRTYADLDVPTEARIALESAILAPPSGSAVLDARHGKASPASRGQVKVPITLEMRDSDGATERTFELRLVAEDEAGRRTEVGPEPAKLRRVVPSSAFRGGQFEIVLRKSPHVIAFALRDADSGELHVARLEFTP